MGNSGVGEKIVVFETPTEKCDIKRIRSFYEAMPEHMQNEILIIGVANYCLGSKDDGFINKFHEALFPKCDKRYFVRYD